MRELYVVHLQRSGGHALSSWLLRLSSLNVVYVNDVCGQGTLKTWKEKGINDIPAETEWTIFGIEDVPLHELTNRLRIASPFIPVLKDPNPIYMFVVRDIHNTLASRWKFHDNGHECRLGSCSPAVVSTWVQYVKTAFLIQHGAGHRLTLQQTLIVNFDRWASQAAYRQALWTALTMRDDGLAGAYDPTAWETVSTWNGGSAFDGVSIPAHQMRVNERYQSVPGEALLAVTDEARFWDKAMFGRES